MDAALVQTFVYLAAAVCAAPIAKRLGLGSVLGYLAAGALIGPTVLNLVGDTRQVAHVAEFGVVILLFLIGLEVRPSLLWSLRTSILGVGSAQVALTTGVLAAAGMAAGLDWRTAVAVGAILAMSSTAVVLQLLEEKGLNRGPVGRAAFGILLFQDLSVIPLLALLPLLAVGPVVAAHDTGLLAGQSVWLKTLALFAAVAAIAVGGRYLTRPVFRIIAKTGLRELFTASALLLVVGVALLMEIVGLSPALGAFLAGVVLADSEYRREIETDIEPFRGLLLGLFFIIVGAGLDFAMMAARPLEIIAVVLGLMLLKSLVVTTAVHLFGRHWREAGAAGVVLSGGGEFAFVLLGVALGDRVLPADLARLLTAAVALSMALTPILLAVYQRMTRAKAAVAAEPENDFDEREPPVIIAGFGRFGQIVGRLLNANGFETAVLESSVEQIELLKRFGRRIYYGDAGRLDLLRAAGADKAKVLIIAINDAERAVEIAQVARESFPHLKVLARAFDRRHAYNLLDAGAHIVERETFEGGLAMGSEALQALGWRAYPAERAARLFRRHDEKVFDQLRPLWGDEEKFTVASRESSPRMDDLLRADFDRMTPDFADGGWIADDCPACVEPAKDTAAGQPVAQPAE
jgi:glutathione-regulated potassium-efflux system ancillary protein KefC/glutathione-regulated potassium-efflux system protein KefB